jgi:predicted O-methyltransferase YrrM
MIPLRRRFTNELNERVSLGPLLRHGPLALAQACIRFATGKRPESPWIPFDAAARLKSFLGRRPSARVLEYGSGMSTLWFAKHANRVISVESDVLWAEKVQKSLHARLLHDKVRLVHTSVMHEYVHVAGVEPGSIDVVVVDGDHRLACGLNAVSICRPDGLIYVDDTDKRANVAEMADLVDAVMAYASSVGGICEFITDYSPAQAFPKQGLLAWLKAEEMKKC